MPQPPLTTERERVAATARRLAAHGLVLGTAGNVSERAGDLVAITPTGASLDRVQGSDIVVVDLEGALVDGIGAPYATFGTEALAEITLDALEGRTAVLMANHGALTFGDDPGQALERTLLLEWVCTIYWRAAAIGTPRSLDEAQLHAVRDQIDARGYGSLLGAGHEEE